MIVVSENSHPFGQLYQGSRHDEGAQDCLKLLDSLDFVTFARHWQWIVLQTWTLWKGYMYTDLICNSAIVSNNGKFSSGEGWKECIFGRARMRSYHRSIPCATTQNVLDTQNISSMSKVLDYQGNIWFGDQNIRCQKVHPESTTIDLGFLHIRWPTRRFPPTFFTASATSQPSSFVLPPLLKATRKSWRWDCVPS